MADPDYVQLPSDATSNKNKIRSFSVVDGEGVTVLEQVSVLADADGNVVDVKGGKLLTVDDEHTALLRAIVQRLDCIAAALDKRYSPADMLGYD